MTDEPRTGQFGGGIFLTVGPVIGLAAGWAVGQPSMGLLAGIAVGAALALSVLLFTR